MRRRLRLAVAGMAAMLAAGACALYGQQVREEAQRVRAEALERYGGEVVSLVVATEPLEAGDVVDRRNTAEREWLVDLAPVDAVRGLDSVLGTEVTVPAAEGAPLTLLNFRDAEDVLEVPEGLVAISVPLSDGLALPRSVGVGSELAAYAVTEGGVRLVSDSIQVIGAPSEQTGLLSGGELIVAVAPRDVAPLLSASDSGALRLALPSDVGALEEVAQAQAPNEVGAGRDGAAAGQDDDGAQAGGDAWGEATTESGSAGPRDDAAAGQDEAGTQGGADAWGNEGGGA